MRKIFTLLFAAVSAANVMAASDDNVVKYDFENYKLIDVENSDFKYYGWYELNADNTENALWASGNPAFTIALMFGDGDKSAAAFPTVAVADGYDGACVKLETKSTGQLAAMLYGMGIAAGNLFTGSFDSENAVTAPMQATQFGKPFYKKPVRFTGYYKYAAGASMQDGKGNAVDGTDQGQIYSVFYRNTDADGNPVVLNGENILTSENIVAIADCGEISDVADWTEFNADFQLKEGKEIDETVLAAGGYSMATVFTSSINGASFIGAVGSTLYVDKVAIECEAEAAEEETKEFKDVMTVNVNGTDADATTTSIFVTKQADGKYTLALKNFYLVSEGNPLPIGSIIINDIEGVEENGYTSLKAENRTITIANGDDEGVDFWMGQMIGEVPINLDAKMTSDKLYATIDINATIMGSPMEIHVVFGSDPTGVNPVTANGNGVESLYSLSGAKVSGMQSGKVYIVRKANGTTTKVIKK